MEQPTNVRTHPATHNLHIPNQQHTVYRCPWGWTGRSETCRAVKHIVNKYSTITKVVYLVGLHMKYFRRFLHIRAFLLLIWRTFLCLDNAVWYITDGSTLRYKFFDIRHILLRSWTLLSGICDNRSHYICVMSINTVNWVSRADFHLFLLRMQVQATTCWVHVRVTNWVKITLCCVRLNVCSLFSVA